MDRKDDFSLRNRLNHVLYLSFPNPNERIHMGTIAEIFISEKLEKIKRNSFRKKPFLYPIFFKEDFYGIAYNRFVDDGKYRRRKSYEFNNNFNFLTLKRLIRKLRQSNYSGINPDQFEIIPEILRIVFNYIFPIESKVFTKKTNEWNSNQSVHSIFSFMENKFDNSAICLNITIPYFLHPEILIRLFRQHVSDTSFIHFTRLLVHQKENLKFVPRRNEFSNSLWNFQIHKFESSLIYIWKQIYNFRSTSFWFFINQTNFVRKIRYISGQSECESMSNIFEKAYSIHYARHRNTLIVTTDGISESFVENWNIYFRIFWEKYFHLWLGFPRIRIKDLSKNPVCFVKYLLYTKSKNTSIQIQLVDNLIDNNFIIKELCTIVPIIPLIRLLAEEKFCDNSGRPICRVSWTTFTDHEIFGRFDKIIRNIFAYYGGSVDRKGLYQLHYILRFSCAKTLACKHKSSIRTVWRKYGSNFVANSVYLEKPRPISWRTYEKKFWYFNIIRINCLAFSTRI